MTSAEKRKSILIWWSTFCWIFIVLFWLIYFSSLNSIQPELEEIQANPEVASLSEVFKQLTLDKPWKFASTQDIVVTSQANGRVSKIYYKEWQQVSWWQPVVALSDTIASYKLQVDRAKNSLNRAILSKQQTELQINQQIEQAQLAYENAQNTFETAKRSTELSAKNAEINVSSADVGIDTLKNNFSAAKKGTINYLDTVIDTADKLLWVSQYYEDNLDSWLEVYVWAKDSSLKERAKQELRQLYTKRDHIKEISDTPSSTDELGKATNELDESLKQASNFAWTMVDVMRNSISSVGTLSQAQIDSYISTFQGLQAKSAGILAEYKAKVDAQVSNSWTVAQEQANIWLESTLLQNQDNLFKAEMALKNAKLALDTILENKDIQLDMLSNAIVDAKIAYETALTSYNKLSVRSPVSWVIGEILVSEWQDVWAWTQIFKVSGTKKQQIEVYITSDEYQYLQDDKPVEVVYQDKILTWNIDAISTVADKTNLFKATIQMDTDISLLWDIAKVRFPIKIQENTLLPLDQVKILNDNEWEIKVWDGSWIEKRTIQIKKVWWSFAELKEALPWNLKLVMN